MRCTPFYGADRRPMGYACGRGQTKPRPCTFCRIACQLLCDGPGCDVPVCGACASSVRALDKDFCPKCIATVIDGCAAAAFVPQVKCVGPQCEKSADGSPVCVAHSLVFTTFLRGGGFRDVWSRTDLHQARKRELFREWVQTHWLDLNPVLESLVRKVAA